MSGLIFLEAIGPAIDRPVRRGRIDHGGIALDHRDRFTRRIIGQAKNGNIGCVQRITPRTHILAGNLAQLDE